MYCSDTRHSLGIHPLYGVGSKKDRYKMGKQYQVVVIDPPWSFDDKLTHSDVPRGAEANYATMTNADITSLPVKDIADPAGCLLALWCPSSLLQTGMDVMKAWGFEQKQTYVWVKTKKNSFRDMFDFVKTSLAKGIDIDKILLALSMATPRSPGESSMSLNSILAFGMGRLFRQTHELCLVGINNTAIYKSLENKSQRSVSLAENLGHSTKPEHLQNSLELMFPIAKSNGQMLEMFARRKRDGWTCLGNEIDGKDIRSALEELKSQ